MTPTDEAVRAELRRIILSAGFIHSERLRRFLTYSVEQTLAGNPQNLKEYSIGIAAFDRPKQYSPAEDPIVRVEARRLRKKLEEYYGGAGASNPVQIELPKGSYVPTFVDCVPPPEPMPPPAAPEPRNRFAASAALLAIAAVGAAAWIGTRHPPTPPRELTRLTSDSGLTTDPSLSLDGEWLAYATDRGASNLNIWIRKTANDNARRLTLSSADHHQPALSPHGDSIAFRSESETPGIYTMSTNGGGDPRLIANEGRDPQYSPDGTKLAYWTGSPGDDLLPPAGRISIVAIAAGAPPAAPLLEKPFASAACPVWSPDGSRILFLGVDDPEAHPDWWTTRVNESRPTPTGAAAILAKSGLTLPFRECTASWQSNGLIFAARGGDTQNLWKLPLDRDGRAHEPLERLTFGSGAEWRPASSSSGAIVFSSRTSHARIWKLARQEMTPIATATSDVSFPTASRDARAVAFLAGSTSGGVQLWWKDLATGREVALTTPPVQPRYPQISPDGARVAFTDRSATPDRAFVASPDSGQLQPLPISAGRIWDWTGSRILYQKPDARKEIEEFDTSTGQTRTLAKIASDLAGPRLSPDLRTLAWHTIPSPVRRQLFTSPYADTGSPTALLDRDGMDRNCAWSPDGRTLYFLSDRDGYRCIWKKAAGNTRPPEAVRHFHSPKQSLSGFGDVGAIGLSATRAGLVFALSDSTSNLWMLR